MLLFVVGVGVLFGCISYGLSVLIPVAADEWRTEPDGPGSGDDRYGDVPGQEAA